MFCNKCGNNIPDGTTFCSKCGNQIAGQPQQYQNPVPPAPQPYVPPVPQPYVPPVPPVAQPYIPTEEKKPAKGLAITSMILGILSIPIFYFPFVTGFLGLLFGIIAKAKGNKSGMSTAGIVCSAIALGLGMFIWIYLISLGSSVSSSSSYYYY